MEKGKLYLIATPIGNLDDITIRAVNTLKLVDVIAAEDTRHSLKLLNHLNISKPLISYHRHNEGERSTVLIQKLIAGENIGLITDAGTPGISDPGEEIVKEAIEHNIDVIPVPGACAAINALIASGLSTKEFIFYGFLPLNKKLRAEKFEEIETQNKTIIIYEAPHRLISTLKDIRNRIGNVDIVIAKELTKIHETFLRGKVEEIMYKLENIRGEYIIIIEVKSKTKKEKEIEILKNMSIEDQYEYYKQMGFEKKEIIKKIAKIYNVSKDEIYKKFINKKC